MELIQDVSTQLIQALQVLSPVLDGLAKFLSSLGSLGFFLLLISLIYWTVDMRLGRTALLALILSVFLSLSLNQLLHQPRPYWLGIVQALASDETYGNPSIHASSSMAVFAYLAYRLNKEWIWAASGLSVLLVGLSRLYLGVEFPLGVISGWCLGLGVAFLCLKLDSFSLPWWKKQSTSQQIGLIFIFSIFFILVGYIVAALIAPSPDPTAWAGFATSARSLIGYYAIAGGVFGIASGYVLMKKHLDYKTSGSLSTRSGRCLLGVAGLGVIYFATAAVIAALVIQDTAFVYTLHYVRFALVSFWVTYAAPWLFLKLSLIKRGIPASV
jgi:membrane-associated phospholipid phosphatase